MLRFEEPQGLTECVSEENEETQREHQNEVCHTKVQDKVGTPENFGTMLPSTYSL